jgi:hypothetical protein
MPFSRQSARWEPMHATGLSPPFTLSYDLIINTGQITISGATEIVLASLHAKLGVRPD